VPIAEYTALEQKYREAQQARVVAEFNARRAEERTEQMSNLHKQTQSILFIRLRAQIKTLAADLSERSQLLEEDKKTIAALKKRIAQLESNTSEEAEAAEAEALGKYFDLVKLQEELLATKAKAEEYVQNETALQAEILEYKKSLDAATEKITRLEATNGTVADLQTLLQMQQKIDTLTLERGSKSASSPTSASGASPTPDPQTRSLIEELSSLRQAKIDAEATIQQLQSQLAQTEAKLAAAASKAASDVPEDYTARLQSMEARIKELTAELLSTTQSLETFRTSSESGTAGLRAELDQLKRVNTTLAESLQSKEEQLKAANELAKLRENQLRTLKKEAQSKLLQASEKIKAVQAQLAQAERDIATTRAQSEENIRKMHAQMLKQRSQSVEQRKQILGIMRNETSQLRGQLEDLRAKVFEMDQNVEGVSDAVVTAVKSHALRQESLVQSLRENYEREMRLRKKVFNQLQELKGNIRVYARVRPLIDRENDPKNHQVLSFIREGEIRVENAAKKQVHNFEFEKVFPPSSTQEQVFEEVSDLVTSVIDGYNVCIFAYGQTGSGKTYTMEGTKEAPGVNTRALDKLFADCAAKSNEWTYSLRITLLEIYNEKIQDLLADERTEVGLKAVSGKEGMEVVGLSSFDVTCAADVQALLAKGKRNRHTTKTDMNEHSSRSHLILSVYVRGNNRLTGATSLGKLHLIDLAGSERVSRSNVTGEALKEAQNINTSLSALSMVIHARANKHDHVPYRNSTLTKLLQDSLEKNSKTLMIVQLSPTLDSLGETLCSLRFAQHVRKVELGKATRAVTSAGVARPAASPVAAAAADDYKEDYPDEAPYDE